MPESSESRATRQLSGTASDPATGLHAKGADARREIGATLETIRTAADDTAGRMPELVRSVRDGASDGVRTIQAWPEPAQRLLAAFSLGLGVGLLASGAPRLIVGGALMPALTVAASTLARETRATRRAA